MKFEPLPIAGTYRVVTDPVIDDRGRFERLYCADEFSAIGGMAVAQTSLSRTNRSGTLRGLHYQAAPHEEAKLVRCIAGEIFDVVVDIRLGSPTFGEWHGERLRDPEVALFLPPGTAHGFQTLEDECLVLYEVDSPFVKDAACGLRWDDPDLAIDWPLPVSVISDADSERPSLRAVSLDCGARWR